MSIMRHIFSAVLNRRRFGTLIAGWTVGIVFAKLPFAAEQSLHVAKSDSEFLVVNGWVLTREDFSVGKLANDVIRLQ
jgi:hypothetical protein